MRGEKGGREGTEEHTNKATSSGVKKVSVVLISERFLYELSVDHYLKNDTTSEFPREERSRYVF